MDITSREEKHLYIQKYLRQAHISKSADQFLTDAKFLSIIVGLIFACIGFVLYQSLIQLDLAPRGMIEISFWDQLSLSQTSKNTLVSLIFSSICFAFFTLNCYNLSQAYPRLKAATRKAGIDRTLPHAVAYMFALSKGGISILEIFRSIAGKRAIYQDTAAEFALIVRDMDYFGIDVISALRNASDRTPSESFKEFLDNFISIINSGGSVPDYFGSKADYFYKNALHEQKMFLDTLGLLAETYVTALVAGPLFLITIIVVLGLISPGSTMLLFYIIYLLIPIGCTLFIILISSLSGSGEEIPDLELTVKKLDVYNDVKIIPSRDADSEKTQLEALKRYDRWKSIKNALRYPYMKYHEKPHRTFYIFFPLAIIYFVIRFYYVKDSITGVDSAINILDDHIVIAILILFTPFAIFHEIRKIRINKIERQIPEFLKRLASINEAGLSLAQAIKIILKSNLGVLTSEVKRIWKTIEWGGVTSEALVKFERRIKTMAISRTITLMVKANESTSDIRDVLQIAARDAEMDQTLKRDRFANMFIYIIVVYISFFVFLFIVYVLSTKFIPMMPSSLPSQGAIVEGAGQGLPLNGVDSAVLTRLLFHASLIQGFCSGLIAGQMGEGSVYLGLKHSLIMLAIGYITFTVFI